MTFRIYNDGKGRAFFNASAKALKASMRTTNRAIAEIIRGGIQRTAEATFQRNSPNGLARSFRVTGVSDQGALVQSDKVYAGIQDRGGIIRPRTAPWLVFQTYDGRWVRTKQVRMPAKRYIERGVESVQRSIESFVRDQVQTVMIKAASASSKGGDRITKEAA